MLFIIIEFSHNPTIHTNKKYENNITQTSRSVAGTHLSCSNYSYRFRDVTKLAECVERGRGLVGLDLCVCDG